MKNLYNVKKFFYSLIICLLFKHFAYAGVLDEKTDAITNKKWELKEGEDKKSFTVSNPQEEELTYFYPNVENDSCIKIKPILDKNKKFVIDSTGKWICVIAAYPYWVEGMAKKNICFILLNPNLQIYVILQNQPKINLEGFLEIDSLNLVPLFNKTEHFKQWVINDDSKFAQFFVNLFDKQLFDSEGKSYTFRKIKNNVSGEVIYSLHLMGGEEIDCINISAYLKKYYDIEIENIDPYARFLNLENRLSLLFYVTDKKTGEKSQFGIYVDEIHNGRKENSPFWRGDHYSRTAPIFDEKWTELLSEQELVDKEGTCLRDPQGNKFIYRRFHYKALNRNPDNIYSCLYAVDKNGLENGINLGYYLDRDFDSFAGEYMKNLRVSSNSQYLQFSTGGNHWAIEISDLQNLTKEMIYSPIMCLNKIFRKKKNCLYSDFISLDLNRFIFSKNTEEEFKKLISKYGLKTPFYLHLKKGKKGLITFFDRDQLRCRNINSFALSNQDAHARPIVLNNKKQLGFTYSTPYQKILLPIPFAVSKSTNEIEELCFDPHFLFPEKIKFEKECETKSFFSSLYLFLGPILYQPLLNLSVEENKYIERIFKSKFFKEVDKKLDKYPLLSLYNELLNYEDNISNTFTKEFLNLLHQRNWFCEDEKKDKINFNIEYFINLSLLFGDLENNVFFGDFPLLRRPKNPRESKKRNYKTNYESDEASDFNSAEGWGYDTGDED